MFIMLGMLILRRAISYELCSPNKHKMSTVLLSLLVATITGLRNGNVNVCGQL